jgi:uncharacterized membrane protein YcgQ (UPF0703/DUF1980 family)
MTKFFKKFSKVQFFLIIIGVLCIGFYFFHDLLPFNKAVVTITEHKTKDGNTVIQLKQSATSAKDEFSLNMSEKKCQQIIHEMSHQKVEAKQKWGDAIPLTDENVSRMIDVVEHNKNNYLNADTYLQILHRWQKHDFSQVVTDHNTIWKMQNGNVGEATGIMSAESEKIYIEAHFKTSQK